ncbi:MAG: urate hydroxylase PuuD [Hyphomicrobiaceae bacterium]
MIDILWAWGEAFLRWLHVIAGIAWIGSSFYFIHLDLSLARRDGLPDKAYGEAWQVHGGGFYHMVKYLVAPNRMPAELTWFKWEAYATWLSGFALLVVVYYFGAELYLVDPAVLDMTPATAALVSVAGIVAGWLLYDALCRSPIGKNAVLLAIAGFAFLVALAVAYSFVLSPRGAFMQMGAIIGTIMAANVLMVIIPGQRKVVADLIAGRTPDPIHGIRGKQRSVHNNYLTLPVVFIMIANHYPLAYATRFSWAILALLLVMGVVIRHFYNSRHKGLPSPWWTWAVAAACGLAIAGVSMLGPAVGTRIVGSAATTRVAFAEVEEIVTSRCSMCHAAEPVWRGITVPPKGVRLDSPGAIRRHAVQIGLNTVASSAMPPGNITGMTDAERRIVAAWLRW